ncbi:VOC family protein [Desulfuromonas carbonis]|uniref:VOC family protein n=1 Tax=Desulfuromonas sp. DDH964 TaxID=1823759 RepID=UPI00078DF15F|nr:lactoylglutathione lyase [Desulfuromonas sp. DDH964]AMV73634.1 glyoxalase [Desulfuromonas sp. DDH964]
MNTNPVRCFEIYVEDLPRAREFYETVLATELKPLASPTPGLEFLAFPMAEGGYGAAGTLVKMVGGPCGGNSTLVYFGCEDCAVEAGRVEKAGGKVEQGKMSIGEYGFIALVRDSEGNMIGLHSMR